MFLYEDRECSNQLKEGHISVEFFSKSNLTLSRNPPSLELESFWTHFALKGVRKNREDCGSFPPFMNIVSSSQSTKIENIHSIHSILKYEWMRSKELISPMNRTCNARITYPSPYFSHTIHQPLNYRGFRKYRISWDWPFCPLFPEIRYFRHF